MGMNTESTRKPYSSRSRRSNSGSDSDSDHFSDSSPDLRVSRRSLRKRERSSGERIVTEEEIKDYMARKAQKKAISVAKRLKTQTVSGYSNESNPFGDSNLNEKFVWRNKIERDVYLGVALDEYSMKSEKKKQNDRMAEIKKVKKRRVERAREKAQREEEMMLLQRERSRAEADDCEKKEEEFHFDHSEVRSVLTKYLDDQSDEFNVEFDEPCVVLQKCLALKEQLELRAKNIVGSLEEDDAVFGSGAEINLDSQVYWWHDKYRPRKPKYFNRVQTCYEWNKYNQTHYDHDNPPPKIVRGYKFNIFYPDLVDKIKAPTYLIEKDGDRAETCIIRFHAGPPYEDIAFRIVNKEWEYSHKKGYKCTFESGILHVYFNFEQHRYRR